MTTKNQQNNDTHVNWMGGASFDVNDPISRLRVAAASSFFGEPMYYHQDPRDGRPTRPGKRRFGGGTHLSGEELQHLRETLQAVDPQEWREMTPAQLMEKAIDEALSHDVEATLKVAADLRQNENVRTTPQVILVRAANHPAQRGTGLVRQYAKKIIQRGDEPSVGLAYQIAVYGRKGIPNSLKKSWKDALEGFDDYVLSKYRMENRPVKTVDVVNLVHPKSDAVDKLVNGELTTSGRTWEAVVSEGGSNKASWEKAMDKMGGMATIRNVRNLLQNDVDPNKVAEQIRARGSGGRQIPFRYYSAYRAVQEGTDAPPQILDAIEDAMVGSLDNLPQFEGKTISLCDNSGSARGAFTSKMGTMEVANIANLSGVLTGMVSDEGYVGVFGDRLEKIPIRKKSSIMDQLQKVDRVGNGIGGSTENGIWLFFDEAIRSKDHYDRIFVYSDEQAGHGGLYGTNSSDYSDYIWPSRSYGWGSTEYIDVASLVAKYREEVNPDVFVYLVQVAGYQNTLIPEYYDRTYILGGWSDSILRFAHKMEGSQ